MNDPASMHDPGHVASRGDPVLAMSWLNQGLKMVEAGRPAEAATCFAQLTRLYPDLPEAHLNLGNALKEQNRFAQAEVSLRRALDLRPDFAMAHFNLAYILLLTGRLEEGWAEYEWRWHMEEFSWRQLSEPRWTGEAAPDKLLLLWAEQGLGDTIQFCRYAALAARRARVVLEVPAPLTRLAATLPGIERVVARGDPVPRFDLHCPLLSLPSVFNTRLDTIPAAPYLTADPAAVARWQARLGDAAALRVGLVWAGGAHPDCPSHIAVDRRRSLALSDFAALAELPGVRFISLQKGEAASQAQDPPPALPLQDWTSDLADFADTAALVAALDLVISVDTAVAHLAGALGKPVWLLNRADTDWRWLLDRADSPWYPTLRQFRQPRPGDWQSVLGALRSALCGEVLCHQRASRRQEAPH